MSRDLQWLVIRRSSSFLLKTKNATFTKVRPLLVTPCGMLAFIVSCTLNRPVWEEVLTKWYMDRNPSIWQARIVTKTTALSTNKPSTFVQLQMGKEPLSQSKTDAVSSQFKIGKNICCCCLMGVSLWSNPGHYRPATGARSYPLARGSRRAIRTLKQQGFVRWYRPDLTDVELFRELFCCVVFIPHVLFLAGRCATSLCNLPQSETDR